MRKLFYRLPQGGQQ